jgi:DNA polymerase-3 subunit delta
VSRRPKTKPDGLTFAEIQRQIKERRIDPLYLFKGEEQYLQERALRLLFESVDEGFRMVNVAILSLGGDAASRSTVAEVVDTANQLPMMSTRRVIVVRDFEKLKESEGDLLVEYLKNPSPTSTVVFQTTSLDQRRKISTALQKACTVVTFDLLSEKQAISWAEGYLKRRECNMEAGALKRLISLVGTRLSRLANELEKLATYADGGTIEESVVDQLVPRAREHTNWELSDALLQRDRTRSIRLAYRLLDDGVDALFIVGTVAGLYRRMLTAKDLMNRGATKDEINKATGRYGYTANEFNERVRRMDREEIVHGIQRLAQVDNAIKNSEASPRLQIEYLVAELTLPESARWGIFGNN